METFYKISEQDLDERFLQALKLLFKDKHLLISIQTLDAEEMDETAYLKSSQSNFKRLMRSVQNVENGAELKEFGLKELKELI